MPDENTTSSESTPPSQASGAPLDAEAPAPTDGFDGGPIEEGGVIGRGGMGEVRRAFDPRLGRDVAVKTAIRQDPRSVFRLEREARLTARLQHPNIVPVFTAGRGSDGRPWYAMRLLDGSTLAAAIRATPALNDRLAFVRNLVDAAGAVAFAHEQGVLHRDLKTSNVMVGRFGETTVTDWGLAVTLEEARLGHDRGVGTPGAMSPEQARGAPLDERADVYALGAILGEIITGDRQPPTPLPIRVRAPGAPPELAAIADRALQANPADRYPTAAAFAADLNAWFEGRRVSAHAYTPWELLRRVAREQRGTLFVVAFSIVTLVVVLAGGWHRSGKERDRALGAEAAARAARDAAEASLGHALIAEARSAAKEDRALDAQVLATYALTLGESPEARGVLARFGGAPDVFVVRHAAPPKCFWTQLSPGGRYLACRTEAGIVVRDAAGDGDLYPVPVAPYAFAFLDAAGTAAVIQEDHSFAVWTPTGLQPLPDGLRGTYRFGGETRDGKIALVASGSVGVLDGPHLSAWLRRLCPVDIAHLVASAVSDGGVVAACADRSIVRGGSTGEVQRIGAYPSGMGNATSLRYDGPPGAVSGPLVIGTSTGDVLLQQGDASERIHIGSHAIATAVVAGNRLLAVLDSGEVSVTDLETYDTLLRRRLPRPAAAWLDDTKVRVVAAADETWSFPDRQATRVITLPAGASSVAIAPDGSQVAVGLGDGTARVYDRFSGHLLATSVGTGVVKDVAFEPSGQHLAVGRAGAPGVQILSTADWTSRELDGAPAVRRVVWSAGRLLWTGWKDGIGASGPGEQATLVPAAEVFDMEASGGDAVALSAENDVLRVGLTEGALTVRVLKNVPNVTAVDLVGQDTVVVDDQALVRLDARGVEVLRWPLQAAVLDLTVSPDGRWAALCGRDGLTRIHRLSDGVLLAVLEGHSARVSGAAFTPDSRWLVTASWDSTLRVWSLDDLESSATALWATVQERTDGGFEEVLLRQ